MFAASEPQPDLAVAHTRAEGGDADAQFFLGLHCSCREGAAQDLPQAAVWYRLAAEQNHPLAQFNLSVMLAEGQGMAKDGAAAEKWMDRAAASGDAGAQFNCGNRCYRELVTVTGGPVDVARLRVEAYVWFQLAAAQGYRGSEASRDHVNILMTDAEVAEGDRRVARFAPAMMVLGKN